jgi:RNA polymerase sigma-70 factor (ECF subfamily)
MKHEQAGTAPRTASGAIADAALLDRLRRGDARAAGDLFRRYSRRVHALARAKCGTDLAARLDAEDIVQCVFRTFFHGAARGKYRLAPGADLWRLFATITVNAVRSQAEYHHAAKRDIRAAPQTAAHSPLHRLAREEQAFVELRLLVRDLLERLTATERQIVQMRLEGHQVEDIVHATGSSRRTVERVLQSFRGAVRAELWNEG